MLEHKKQIREKDLWPDTTRPTRSSEQRTSLEPWCLCANGHKTTSARSWIDTQPVRGYKVTLIGCIVLSKSNIGYICTEGPPHMRYMAVIG